MQLPPDNVAFVNRQKLFSLFVYDSAAKQRYPAVAYDFAQEYLPQEGYRLILTGAPGSSTIGLTGKHDGFTTVDWRLSSGISAHTGRAACKQQRYWIEPDRVARIEISNAPWPSVATFPSASLHTVRLFSHLDFLMPSTGASFTSTVNSIAAVVQLSDSVFRFEPLAAGTAGVRIALGPSVTTRTASICGGTTVATRVRIFGAPATTVVVGAEHGASAQGVNCAGGAFTVDSAVSRQPSVVRLVTERGSSGAATTLLYTALSPGRSAIVAFAGARRDSIVVSVAPAPPTLSGPAYAYDQWAVIQSSSVGSYTYEWQERWCTNGFAPGDCDYAWRSVARGANLLSVTSWVARIDFWKEFRVLVRNGADSVVAQSAIPWRVNGAGEGPQCGENGLCRSAGDTRVTRALRQPASVH